MLSSVCFFLFTIMDGILSGHSVGEDGLGAINLVMPFVTIVNAVFIIPSAFSTVLQGFCRNDGSPVLVSAVVIVSTVCNIFGDWLLIFPIPWGLKGAAIVTGVSQTFACFIVLSHYLLRKGDLHFYWPILNTALFKKIALRGLPESIPHACYPCCNLSRIFHLIAFVKGKN